VTRAAQAGERTKLGYRPGLDGLRAVAVSGVIGFHYYRWPGGGNGGVELFFVLSGFLITTLLVEEWRERNSISLPRFYLRRALRLLPALWFFLLVWTVLSASAGHFQLKPLVLGFTYTTNLATVVDGHAPGLSHLWSLGNEEQFYLLWPILLIGLLRLRTPPLRLAAVAGALALAEIVARDMFSQNQLGWLRFDAMLVGCVAGILFASPLHGKLRAVCCAPPVAAASATVAIYLLLKQPDWSFMVGAHRLIPTNLVFSVASIVSIVWVVEGCPGFRPAHWFLASTPIAYVGRISYALYLWHPFVLSWLLWQNGGNLQSERWAAPIAVACSFCMATVSYWLVERRFLRMKWRLSATGSHDADATVLIKRHDLGAVMQPELP
jgi:peptidoglycan/LPS O-acetylase OafA/YrhL